MTDTQSTAHHPRAGLYYFVGMAVLISAVLSIPWPRRAAPLTAIEQRRLLPDAALERLDGGEWRLEEHRGQIVLLNYWASWCLPCREETPGLVKLAEQVGPGRLAVVGISMDTGDRSVVRHFVEQMHISYPIVFPEAMSQIATGMVGLPTTVLVDRKGRVAKTYIGETREAEFRKDVELLLSE